MMSFWAILSILKCSKVERFLRHRGAVREEHIKFGVYTLDIGRHKLTKAGQPIRLGSRAFEILCVLASARGQVVTKDQLMERVWPGLVVEENALYVHISSLRKTLDNGDAGPSFVLNESGRGYRLTGLVPMQPVTAAPNTSGALSLPARPSIAVLPFYNMSDDSQQEYFADGIVEDIITGLSRIEWLSVIARNSSFVFKGRNIDVMKVGQDLGVRYVLEGSVRRHQNRVRITAQLIEASTGMHVWAERYDRVLDDIFAVQDEITVSAVAALEPSIQRVELELMKRDRPVSLGAYDLVLQATPFMQVHMPDSMEPAIALLTKALELEPDFFRAHAQLARCFHIRFSRGGLHEKDRVASIRHARAAMGSNDATTLAFAALVIWWRDDVATALELYDRALAISNSNTAALGNSAFHLAWMGKTDIAIERASRALRFSPLEPLLPYLALSVAHYIEGRYEEARSAARRAVEATPQFSVPCLLLSAACQRLGRTEEARAAANQAGSLDPTFTIRTISLSLGKVPEVFSAFADAWREAGLPDQ
jgi:TolB-like protein/Tfp pilus assembly protein PilF